MKLEQQAYVQRRKEKKYKKPPAFSIYQFPCRNYPHCGRNKPARASRLAEPLNMSVAPGSWSRLLHGRAPGEGSSPRAFCVFSHAAKHHLACALFCGHLLRCELQLGAIGSGGCDPRGVEAAGELSAAVARASVAPWRWCQDPWCAC